MNSTKKQSNMKKMVYRYGQKVAKWRINTKALRIFASDVILAALSIAWLVEHLQSLAKGLEIIFATLFIGLVLYFKHKG